MSKLPIEVIGLVIAELSRQNDSKSLSACSLVCKAWLQWTSDAIFNTIMIIGKPDIANRCKDLLKLIEARPALARSVRGMFLGGNFLDLEENGWLQTSPDIAPLLRKLTMIQALWICGMHIHWSTLPDDLKSALYDLFARPTMRKIYLDRISEIDISPFVQYGHISELSLNAISIVPFDDGDLSMNEGQALSPTAPAGNLRMLNLAPTAAAAVDAILKAPNPTLNFRGLASLQVSTELWDDAMQSVWDRVTAQCAATVTNLRVTHMLDSKELFGGEASPFPFQILDFTRFSSLSMLTFHTNGYFIDNVPGHDILPQFLTALRSLASVDNVLQRFELKVGYNEELAPEPLPCIMQTIEKTEGAWPYMFWRDLDTVLVSSGFKMLRVFVLRYGTGIGNDSVPWDSLDQSLKELLPQLVKRGLLDGPRRDMF
ncbi:other/FunK1 protein kinase [Coprinopsis cinerea AmutBmut pab1-1]|nr:other/FunK1 protein kinase [Coprinopsis cinerea AmutBmut pab1-1]